MSEDLRQEVERLRQVIDRHDYGIMPVGEGYMAARAERAEKERDEWRERAERAEDAIARVRVEATSWAELAEPGDDAADWLDLAIADCGRAVLDALDGPQAAG